MKYFFSSQSLKLLRSFMAQLVCICIVLGLGAIFQTKWPVIPTSVWERLTETLYIHTLGRESINANPDLPSVAIVEIDQSTIDALGWPIPRETFITFFDKLANSGHPYVLSLLRFQANLGGDESDIRLAAAMEDYEKVIGSGLQPQVGLELSFNQETLLLPNSVISQHPLDFTEWGIVNVGLQEDDLFVASQNRFGFGAMFGDEKPLVCSTLYLSAFDQGSKIVFPSATLWAASLATPFSFTTPSGVGSGEQGHPRSIRSKFCLSATNMSTPEFLSTHVRPIRFIDVVEGWETRSLENHIVILSSSEMRSFVGPGPIFSSNNESKEHQLLARFLYSLVHGSGYFRSPLAHEGLSASLPIWCSIFTVLATLLFRPLLISMTLFFSLVMLASYSFYISRLTGEILFQGHHFGFLLLASTTFLAAHAFQFTHGLYISQRFLARLQKNMGSAATLEDLILRFQHSLITANLPVEASFGDLDEELYGGITSPEILHRTLDKLELSNSKEQKLESKSQVTPSKSLLSRWHIFTLGIRDEFFHGQHLLGRISINITASRWQCSLARRILIMSQGELLSHWEQIHMQVTQKLHEQARLIQKNRSEILGRFLTKNLVNRFSDSLSMDENLQEVLTPRSIKATIMQADIRGFSKLAARYPAETLVEVLQSYYRRVVDEGQDFAQIKLIGDCIFAFIEDTHVEVGRSTCDIALDLCKILISDTVRLNQQRALTNDLPVYFGIGIHYGQVVVGNLSSDTCIDYTVIGNNVNLTARLEELTKAPQVQETFGVNCLLLTKEAINHLSLYKTEVHSLSTQINLNEKCQIRSFPEVKEIYGLNSKDLEVLYNSNLHAPYKSKMTYKEKSRKVS